MICFDVAVVEFPDFNRRILGVWLGSGHWEVEFERRRFLDQESKGSVHQAQRVAVNGELDVKAEK